MMSRKIINNFLSTRLKLESGIETMVFHRYKEAQRVEGNCIKNAVWSQEKEQRSSKSESQCINRP